MKILCKRGIAWLLVLVLAFSLSVTAFAAEVNLADAVQGSASYMLKTVTDPQVGSVGGEWAVIGLARSGYSVPQSYWDTYYATVEEYVQEHKGNLHDKKYTEYSRLIVALTAIGADPTDVAGYNLLAPLGDFDKTIYQGINGPIWALIALDTADYAMPQNAAAQTQATRQMYINEILARQLDDGGWNLTDKGGDGEADPDLTGMALQALANYQDQAVVKSATDLALTCLSKMQQKDGGFESHQVGNSESVAQVIVGLCALGIDLEDSRFVKNGHTLLENLLSYRNSDGSFLHTGNGSGNNQMSSEQGLYAMAAALRAQQGKNSLYDMSDVTISVTGQVEEHVKDQVATAVPVTNPGKTFSDISGHTNQTAIEALASREIIDGMGGGKFAPDKTMTRAEFATIVVRGLGLTPKATNTFQDVSSNSWYASYVGTASTLGIIKGVSGGKFNPEGTITRQEAATMIARAAKLCGMDPSLDSLTIRDTLAQFSDYTTIASWAQESMAFCYRESLLDDSALTVEPTRAILRCEIAQILYNLLDKAELL